MQDSGGRTRRIELIRRNPVAYLESSLKSLKFFSPSDLVACLYDFERFGSVRAQRLLDLGADVDRLLAEVPAELLLRALPREERNRLKLTLNTLGFQDLKGKTAAHVIGEIEKRLEQLKK